MECVSMNQLLIQMHDKQLYNNVQKRTELLFSANLILQMLDSIEFRDAMSIMMHLIPGTGTNTSGNGTIPTENIRELRFIVNSINELKILVEDKKFNEPFWFIKRCDIYIILSSLIQASKKFSVESNDDEFYSLSRAHSTTLINFVGKLAYDVDKY